MIAHHMTAPSDHPTSSILQQRSSASKTMDMFLSERDWLQFSPTAQFLLTSL